MENIIALRRRIELSFTHTNIITFITVAIFMPYILSGIILVSLAIYIITNKYTRQLIFVHNGSCMLKIFFLYILAVPLVYKNWIGFIIGIGMIFAIILGLYMRSVMTKELYDKILHQICIMSLTSAGYAIFEKVLQILLDQRYNHRIAAVFAHPNYFGTVVGTVIIICAYKVLTNQGNRWFYILVAGMNVISMYLCKSMFVWVEVFVGIAVLLAVYKKNKLLAIWLSGAVVGAFLIFGLKLQMIPRLTDIEVTVKIRMRIWKQAIIHIKETPLFGQGFLSFRHIFNSTFRNRQIPHAHNIFLDSLLNFGIIGSLIIVIILVKYYVSVLYTRFKEKNILISSLILTVSVAGLVHGMTDLTLLWIQTFPLFLIILSGLGADDKNGRYHLKTDLFY